METKNIFGKKGKFIIFKHSSICASSEPAKEEVKKYVAQEKHFEVVKIEVIKEAKLKMEIAERYFVRHESPQILFIENQKCVDNFDHGEITFERLKKLK